MQLSSSIILHVLSWLQCLQWQRADFPLSLPPQYHLNAVKKLNLEVSLSNHQVATILSCLLNSCPNLCDLRIQVRENTTLFLNVWLLLCCRIPNFLHFEYDQDTEHLDTTGNYWESQNPSQCLINHLRTIQICGVNLHRSYWIGFVKFLLMNACVCEKITIQYASDSRSRILVEQKLKMFQWASPYAILEVKSSA